MIRVIRSATYTMLPAGIWEAVGSAVTADEAGIATRVTITVAPEVASVVDAAILQVGIRRGLSVVSSVPFAYQLYRDLSATTDFSAPPSVQSVAVRWRLEPGDEVVVYGGSGNGCNVYVVLDVEPVAVGLAQRLPPLPGDAQTPAATWAMAPAASRRRWNLMRWLLGSALALLLVCAGGCATTKVSVTCTVTSVGPQGSVTMQCTPTADGASRARGDVQLALEADLLRRKAEQQEAPNK